MADTEIPDKARLEADLAAFYDQQTPTRAQSRPDPEREIRRAAFVELLRSEGRATVFEVGTGPGRDAIPFLEDGFAVSGIDLSEESVRHCVDAGIDCRQASLFDIPFEDGMFPAAWTMSTLLHVPDTRIDDALLEVMRVLEPGAPIAIGVWGGPDSERYRLYRGIEIPRFFSSWSDGRWRAILERYGTVERFDTWVDQPESDMHYQYAVLRKPAV
jgi:SAM-dependent methyltransferase